MAEENTNKSFLEVIAERKSEWSKYIKEMSDTWSEKKWGQEFI